MVRQGRVKAQNERENLLYALTMTTTNADDYHDDDDDDNDDDEKRQISSFSLVFKLFFDKLPKYL